MTTSSDSLFGLDSKRAFVAGGGQGIGRSCALLLARASCDVALLDVEAERGQGVVEEIEAGDSVPITEQGALDMPTDPDDADDIRDDNNPDDVGQEALDEPEEGSL